MTEHQPPSPEANINKKPGLLRRLGSRSLRAAQEAPEPENPEAPLGYIEGTDIPKHISTVHVIDPDGNKPTEIKRYRNW